VQQLVEEAIEKFSAEVVRIQGSGRTDSGVHAKGQVAHFDLAAPRDARAVRDGLNYFLKPHPVSIIEAEAVEETFNARRDAKERTYLYRILNRRSPAALEAGRVWHVAAPLDVALDASRGGAAGRSSRFHQLPRQRVSGQITAADAG
jgi:tRNA pseudouridine38-40 synthase